MAVAVDPNTGWSVALSCKSDANMGQDSSYGPVDATWFYGTWFNRNRWARKFTNLTKMRLQMKSGSFTVVSGHSGGETFASMSGGVTSLTAAVNGGGCTFHADIFVEGNNSSVSTSAPIDLPTIVRCNASSSNGVGTVSKTNAYGTVFGKLKYYGPGTGRDLDANGNKTYSHLETITFDDGPIIEPGQSVYVVVHPTNFKLNAGTSLLVIEQSVTSWEAALEPAPSDYIWVYTKDGWVKKKTAMGYDGSTWNKLEVE